MSQREVLNESKSRVFRWEFQLHLSSPSHLYILCLKRDYGALSLQNSELVKQVMEYVYSPTQNQGMSLIMAEMRSAAGVGSNVKYREELVIKLPRFRIVRWSWFCW